MARNIPVLGHCLGGQLMARTLGARVGASPAPEIGWQRIECADAEKRRQWFGPAPVQHVFHWHYEAFDLPAGAISLASSPTCPHQAFAIGLHLALQFHVEVDERKVRLWLSRGAQPSDPVRNLLAREGFLRSPQGIEPAQGE